MPRRDLVFVMSSEVETFLIIDLRLPLNLDVISSQDSKRFLDSASLRSK
jgi:hypothetical protein